MTVVFSHQRVNDIDIESFGINVVLKAEETVLTLIRNTNWFLLGLLNVTPYQFKTVQ